MLARLSIEVTELLKRLCVGMAHQDDDLVAASDELGACITRLADLNYLYENNSNFRYIDPNTNKLATAACLQQRGTIKVQQAAQQTPKNAGANYERHRDKWAATAEEDFDQAMEIFKDEDLVEAEPRQCKKGIANTYKCKGQLKYMEGKLQDTRDTYKHALDLYSEIQDDPLIEQMEELIERLDLEIDRISFIKDRTEKMAQDGSREEQAVKTAFEKFDQDRSGELSMAEFGQLAIELGTDPPLRPEELAEGIAQLDLDGTGEMSFDELWAWWCAEDVENALKAAQQAKS
jgi:Ca2+-binding EF-hand superfamily protein